MVMINPGFVVGPGLIGKGYTSGEVLDKFMHGKLGEEAGMIRSLVEVSAVAEAHFNAVKVPEAAGKRFILLNTGLY